MSTTTLAHISDLHVLELAGVSARRYLNKRLTGLANLVGARRDHHPVAVAEALVADLEAQAFDHVLVTGDLTNLALESEFERAREVLEPIARYDHVSVIPGNHDIYTRGSARDVRYERYFGDLMWPPGEPHVYPFFKEVGEIAVVGLRSAVPRLPFIASGHVDRGQLGRLAQLAAEHRFHERFVVGLVHHNLHARGLRKDLMHGLRNRDEVLEACARAGVDLLAHGHTHKANRSRHGGMLIVGSGSSTWSNHREEHRARYNVYHVRDGRLDHVEVRVHDPSTGAFPLHERFTPDQV